MKLSTRSIIGVFIVAAAIAACGGSDSDSGTSAAESVQPGDTATEQQNGAQTDSRNLQPFDSVEVMTALAVELTVASGTQQAVTVETPKGFTGEVKTNVSGDILRISQSGSYEGEGPRVTVDISQLKSLSITQASNVTASGTTDTYQVTLNQGSNMDASGLRANDVKVQLSNGSNAEIFAADKVTGSLVAGSNLQVRGDADTSGVQVDTGSNLSN